MKTIYLVRHGQTDGNVAMRHQHPDIELNELGHQQAARVADVLAKCKPTLLITSTNVRAVMTARYIARATSLIPQTYPAFEELHRPRGLIGERFFAPRSLSFLIRWFLGWSTPYQDAETYADFVTRLATARMQLEELPDNSRVVVVSHAVFIQFFTMHLNQTITTSPWSGIKIFFQLLRFKNTGIITLHYDTKQAPPWTVHSDAAHR